MAVHQVVSLRAQAWMLCTMISPPICGEQTGKELKLQSLNPTHNWLCWRPWGCPTPVWGIPGSHPASTCLGIWSLKGCHAPNCLGICQSKGPRTLGRSTCLNLPRDPILGRPTCLDLPRGSISRRLSCFSLPGDQHPDPGTPGSQVAIVLGRISFRKTHP